MTFLSSPLWTLGQESKALQRQLKALGVAPPPPPGRGALADIMKPGRFYEFERDAKLVPQLERYVETLQLAVTAAQSRWTADAHGHSVLMAAQDAAPASARLSRPHGGVPAKPVIDALGYVHAALLAARSVEHLVSKKDRVRFRRLVELGERVVSKRAFGAGDQRVIDDETPRGQLASRALTRLFTADAGPLRVAQGIAIDAEHAVQRGVAGKGSREACISAVQLLSADSKAVRSFLEQLDAVLLREDARTQFEKVAVKPSSPVKRTRWRGASKGKPSHWLVELESGGFALLWKAKGKWRVVEGARHDVLACVTDTELRAATEALLGSEK